VRIRCGALGLWSAANAGRSWEGVAQAAAAPCWKAEGADISEVVEVSYDAHLWRRQLHSPDASGYENVLLKPEMTMVRSLMPAAWRERCGSRRRRRSIHNLIGDEEEVVF